MIQKRNNRNCTRHESIMILVITILVGLILSNQSLPSSSTSTLLYVNAQEIWNGCIDPSKNKQQNLIRIQQPTRVCLSIANDTNWNSGNAAYIRASFEPKADVYSRFHIPNCTSTYDVFVYVSVSMYALAYLLTFKDESNIFRYFRSVSRLNTTQE
jgi:hypothetical protein